MLKLGEPGYENYHLHVFNFFGAYFDWSCTVTEYSRNFTLFTLFSASGRTFKYNLYINIKNKMQYTDIFHLNNVLFAKNRFS